MTQRLYALLGASLLVTAFAVGQAPRTVQVDVNYTGSGTVDASHKIYVALWESTEVGIYFTPVAPTSCGRAIREWRGISPSICTGPGLQRRLVGGAGRRAYPCYAISAG